MKKLFTAAFLLFSILGFSQSVFKPASVIKSGPCDDPEVVGYSTFINKFGSPNLKFVRFENSIPKGWTAAYCDCEFCRDVTTDTALFYIPIGDSCVTSAHFYPVNIVGTGVMKIKVFDPKFPDVFVVGQYTASCTSGATLFLKMDELKVYPNPASTVLNIQFGSGDPYTISIVSADGKVLMNQKVDLLGNNVDISGLTTGLYSAKIESAGKVFFARFVKL